MKRISFILLLAVAAGVGLARPTFLSAQVSRDTEALKLYTEGRDLYDERRFPEAEKKFREALSKYPRAERADRTAYYLIITLEQLSRIAEARTEIETFQRTYPMSEWSDDVIEKGWELGGKGTPAAQDAKIAIQRAASQALGSTDLPRGASMQAEALRQQIQMSPATGFESARDRLTKNPDDPVLIANLGTVYLSHSPQALSFLMDLMTYPTASPKTRELAFYWFTRKNPNKAEVAEELMEKLKTRENEPMVSEALFRMRFEEHRQVLEGMAESSNPDKYSALEKIYRRGSITLRSDLVTIVAKIPDPRAIDFILKLAENDKDLAVREAAVDALMSRKDVDATRLETILKTTPRPPRRTTVISVPLPIAPRGARGPSAVTKAPAPVPPPPPPGPK
jgi:tetratricopeptide (TPR) repeat protein